ncbi:MAG TPA: hypothetical protein VES42_28225 [Pilimelia sp.]|nr:hypothetical protein [Pilimelia sp.]
MSEGQRRPRPSYYRYNKSPVKVMFPDDYENPGIWRLSIDTGGWKSVDSLVLIELQSDVGGEVDRIDRKRFIDLTESERAYYLRGDGPIFALYGTIAALEDQAISEGRPLTQNERAMIHGLRRKTYAMFERELHQRGDPGADPDPES